MYSYFGHLIFLPSLFHLQARTFATESWKLVNQLIRGQISCTTHFIFTSILLASCFWKLQYVLMLNSIFWCQVFHHQLFIGISLTVIHLANDTHGTTKFEGPKYLQTYLDGQIFSLLLWFWKSLAAYSQIPKWHEIEQRFHKPFDQTPKGFSNCHLFTARLNSSSTFFTNLSRCQQFKNAAIFWQNHLTQTCKESPSKMCVACR